MVSREAINLAAYCRQARREHLVGFFRKGQGARVRRGSLDVWVASAFGVRSTSTVSAEDAVLNWCAQVEKKAAK